MHVLVPIGRMGAGFVRRFTSGVRLSAMIIQQLELQCFVCLIGLQCRQRTMVVYSMCRE